MINFLVTRGHGAKLLNSFRLVVFVMSMVILGCTSPPPPPPPPSAKILPIIPKGERYISYYGVSEDRQIFELKVINGEQDERITLALSNSEGFCKSKSLERWVIDKYDGYKEFQINFSCIPSKEEISRVKQRDALESDRNERIKNANKVARCELDGYKRGSQKNAACVDELDRIELKNSLELLEILQKLNR